MVCELRQKNGTKVTEKNKGKREKSAMGQRFILLALSERKM